MSKIIQRDDIEIKNRDDLRGCIEAIISENFPRQSQDGAIDASAEIVNFLEQHSLIDLKFCSVCGNLSETEMHWDCELLGADGIAAVQRHINQLKAA